MTEAYSAWDWHRLKSPGQWSRLLGQALEHPVGSVSRLLEMVSHLVKPR
ncbi:hypothetical protein ACFL2Q_08475 [Thermodesulfobacteriota bacterium]